MNMMDKHQNFICHVTPIQNVKMVICTVMYILYTEVRVNKRTPLRGSAIGYRRGGGGLFFIKKSLHSRWCRY